MKILHVIASTGTGGAEQHVLDLCLNLRLAGVESEVAMPNQGRLGQQLGLKGFVTHTFGTGSRLNVFNLLRLRNIVRQSQADVVHAHMPRSASMLRWSKQTKPCVATAHNIVKHGWPFLHCQRVICVSDMVCRSLNKHGYPLDNTVVIHNAVDTNRFTGLSRDLIREQMAWQDKQVILCVARLVPAKGQRYAIQAVARLNRPDLRLVLAGSGTDENLLRDEAHALGISQQVVFAGNRQDVPQLLAGADIYVQPSIKEGFGIAFLEAMASGLACIGTRTGAIPEMVQTGRNGWLIDAGNSDELADVLCNLLDNHHLRKQLGEQAARDARTTFSLQRQAQDTISVYQQVLMRKLSS